MNDNLRDARAGQVFVGRQDELAALASALASASAGEPRVVLIQGGAGIGKSSLVFEFLARQRGVRVISASADESETVLPYGVLAQLAAAAATISSDALTGLELLAYGPPPDADPLAVGVDLLAMISSLQRKAEPTVLVVEDAQWADPLSAQALLFACRRLGADHLLVLLTCRAEGMSRLGTGWARFIAGDRRITRLTLGGLDARELGLLCQRLGRTRLSRQALQGLAHHSGGNPLLARALLAELTDGMLAAEGGLARLPKSLADLVLPRLAALSLPARNLVVAVSVLGDHCALADAAAVGGLAGPAAELEEATQAGFLTQQNGSSGWVVSFTHLLVREAVYGALGAGSRSQLHLRAAAVMDGQESLAHRAAAALGPDPALASDLSEAATGAAATGKLLVAARWLQRAAAVTARGPDRNDRMLSAFELQVQAADVAAAEAIRPLVEQFPASARRDTALGLLALLSARPLDAQTLLQAAWDGRDPLAENSAGEAAFGLGALLGMSGSFTAATVWLDRALRTADGSEPWYDGARCIRALPFALSGETGKALNLFRDLPGRAAMVPARHTDALTYRGIVRLWSDDLPAAAEDLGVAVSRIRAGLQVRFPSQPLGFLAETEFRAGRWDDSRAHAELAVSLACDADRDYDLAFAHSLAVPVAACRGDWAAAVGHVEAAEKAAPAFGGFATIFIASAHGILGFARDDPDEALRGTAQALSVAEIDRYDDPAAFWWRPMQIWALIRSGQLGEAGDILTAFESRLTARGSSSALIHATWLRGALAMASGDLDQADHVLRRGRRASGGLTFPFYRGLLDLEHGRCMSRLHQRRDAIDALHAAHGVFAALAARPFMQASEAGLATLGLRPRAAGDAVLPGLTGQELRVARLVASGLSNREVAAQLYLSPKTVEYHLVHVFTKLGLRNRHQLAARLRGDDPGVHD
jgi:DNA-binding CsgD family transcriptional regulator